MSKVLFGSATARGIAYGNVVKLQAPKLDILRKTVIDAKAEIQRFLASVKKAKSQLKDLEVDVLHKIGESESQIFASQSLMLSDPQMLNDVSKMIEEQLVNAEYALDCVIAELMKDLSRHQDSYFKERIFDLKDIKSRLLNILCDVNHQGLDIQLMTNMILVAESLSPSEAAKLDIKYISGIITKEGGITAHASILATKLGIPAIAGININEINEQDHVIIDTDNDQVIVNPDVKDQTYYRKKIDEYKKYLDRFVQYEDLKAQTKDGHLITIGTNIANLDDVKKIKDNQLEAIGLFRTECLFMANSYLPSECEQTKIYQDLLNRFKDKKIVIRTLDIGGDKPLSYLSLPKESNPFLGQRGIRFSLNYPKIFKSQIKALLTANTNSNLSILLPMVSNACEVIQAKNMIEEIKKELNLDTHYRLGIMVEVPAIAFNLEQIAPYIDFISIGSNDLIQYFFAADRLNPIVSSLYQPLSPVFLRFLDLIIKTANKLQLDVSVCGQMAAQSEAALILVGLGVNELSMDFNIQSQVKYALAHYTYQQLKNLAKKALKCQDSQAVIKLLK